MKLLVVAMGLVATEVAVAHQQYSDFIPYDCFRETFNYGEKAGSKVSDRDLISGLGLATTRMAYISACTSLDTRLITGIVTVWGTWNSGSGAWENLQSMNVVGSMSGLQEFDDNAAIRSFAGPSFTLTREQDIALMELWYQEASPNQKEHYANQNIDSSWTGTRQTIFDEEDRNSDGVLNYAEASLFLARVRPLDGKNLPTDEKQEKIDRAWNYASLLSGTDADMTFADYTDMEKSFEAFYANGKLEATGHARGQNAGDDLSHHCTTYQFDDQDEIKLAQVTSSEGGVQQVTIQTNKEVSYDLGSPDSNSSRYAYSDSNWVRFDDGNTLYGLWGTTDSNGEMNSLGFVRKDASCYGPFSAALGANINWNTPIPGTELVEPTLPLDAQTWLDNKFNELPLLTPTPLNVPVPGVPQFPDLPLDGPPSGPQPGTIQPTDSGAAEPTTEEAPAEESTAENDSAAPVEGGDDEWLSMKVAAHDHDETAESGLIAAAIAIWALVAILFVAFLIMYCSEKKSRAANYTVQ